MIELESCRRSGKTIFSLEEIKGKFMFHRMENIDPAYCQEVAEFLDAKNAETRKKIAHLEKVSQLLDVAAETLRDFNDGILAMLFAVTHAWNGQSAVLPMLYLSTIDLDTRIVFMYVWHIITAENLVFGIAFMFMSFPSERSKIRFVAWMIVSLLIVRLTVILGITAFQDVSAITDTLLDSIIIIIYVVFIMLGIRMKQKEVGG